MNEESTLANSSKKLKEGNETVNTRVENPEAKGIDESSIFEVHNIKCRVFF